MRRGQRSYRFKSKALMCVALVLNMQYWIGGCGTSAAQLSIGSLRTDLTPDHPLTEALGTSAFAGARALVVDPSSQEFYLVFPDGSRQLSGSYASVGGLPTIRELHAKTDSGSLTITFDDYKRIARITTSDEQHWERPTTWPLRSDLRRDVSVEAFVEANAELMRLAGEMDREHFSTMPGAVSGGIEQANGEDGGGRTDGSGGRTDDGTLLPAVKSGPRSFGPVVPVFTALILTYAASIALQGTLIFIFAVVVAALLTIQPSRAAWGTAGANAQRTWMSPFSGPAKPQKTGRLTIPGEFSGVLIGRDGTAYLAENAVSAETIEGRLHAVSADDASESWVFKVQDWRFDHPTMSADGTIYVTAASLDAGCNGSRLYAITLDGNEKWSVCTMGAPARPFCSPAIGPDGVVYLTTNVLDEASPQGHLQSFSPAGDNEWSLGISGGCGPAAISTDGTIYVLGGIGLNTVDIPDQAATLFVLHAISPDGNEKWATSIKGTAAFAPAIGPDGTIYVPVALGPASDSGSSAPSETRVYAFNPDGSEKWNSAVPAGSFYPDVAICDDGTLYILASGSTESETILYAIGAEGEEKWNFSIGGLSAFVLAIGIDGIIYMPTTRWGQEDTSAYPLPTRFESKLYAISPDGTEEWSYDLVTNTSGTVVPAFMQAVVGPTKM